MALCKGRQRQRGTNPLVTGLKVVNILIRKHLSSQWSLNSPDESAVGTQIERKVRVRPGSRGEFASVLAGWDGRAWREPTVSKALDLDGAGQRIHRQDRQTLHSRR